MVQRKAAPYTCYIWSKTHKMMDDRHGRTWAEMENCKLQTLGARALSAIGLECLYQSSIPICHLCYSHSIKESGSGCGNLDLQFEIYYLFDRWARERLRGGFGSFSYSLTELFNSSQLMCDAWAWTNQIGTQPPAPRVAYQVLCTEPLG